MLTISDFTHSIKEKTMTKSILLFGIATASMCLAATASAQTEKPESQSPDAKVDISASQTDSRIEMLEKSIAFLGTRQADDGSFSSQTGPAITAIVATGLLKNGIPAEHPIVAKALTFLTRFAQPSGGIHQKETFYKNYETSLSLICFASANEDGKYSNIIKKAEGFLKGLQSKEGSSDPTDVAYGGIGYGSHQRPDLSNTSVLVDALKAAGNGADDDSMKRALAFISRCQNMESEHNTTPFSAKVNDGGMYYTPAAGGKSQAGDTENGGLKSYGSMTYAGLKSMIFAGVKKDDPRVQAAIGWIKKNYSLKANPGMGRGNLGAQGLFYYFHIFGKALDAIQIEEFTDSKGIKHQWRKELLAELSSRQGKDGSWLNVESDRWMEGDANLVTGYALLALSYCEPPKKK